MTEQMLKLFLNKKCIGYEYRECDKVYHIKTVEAVFDIGLPWKCLPTTQQYSIKHDSWQLGYKRFDGTWVFAGDEIVRTWVYEFSDKHNNYQIETGTKTANGNLVYGDYGWEIKPEKNYEMSLFYVDGVQQWSWDEITKKEK